MVAEGVIGIDRFGHQVWPQRGDPRIHMLTIIAEGPTIKPALLYRSEVVGHKISAEFVALVDNRPKHAGFGLPTSRRDLSLVPAGLMVKRNPEAERAKGQALNRAIVPLGSKDPQAEGRDYQLYIWLRCRCGVPSSGLIAYARRRVDIAR
jgi:hypothetical protein